MSTANSMMANETFSRNNSGSEVDTVGLGESDMEDEMIHLQTLMVVVPIVVPILFTLVIIIGFIGNLLVVLVVILNKTMRNTTNILIFNLAVRFYCKPLAIQFVKFCIQLGCSSK